MSGGFLSVLRHLGLAGGAVAGSISPATLLDDSHEWFLYIDGTDRWGHVEPPVTWSEFEGGEIGTLRATLKEYGTALDISEWQEIVLKDGETPIWGGYIVSATPVADGMGNVNRLTWEITAESYATILARTRRVRKSYNGEAPGDILVDLFDQALDPDSDPPNQVEFDTATYVTTGSWPDNFTFASLGEPLTDTLDRLALLAGYVWWIDAGKAVHFGSASSSTADFGIKLAGDADFTSYFPPNKGTINAKVNAKDIRNRITVIGGTRVSAVLTEMFTGDGSTLLFTLAHSPIAEVISVSVGGVYQTFGTDWYHSFDDYNCLVNYSLGTVRWDTGNAPPNLDTVIVRYRYGETIKVVVSDTASIAHYGRVFDYELVDKTLNSEAAATAAGNAMLAEYAFGTVNGSLDIGRLGLKAGQRISITYAALSLSGYYQIRQINGAVRKHGLVTLTVKFGGRRPRFSNALSGTLGAGAVVPGNDTSNPTESVGGSQFVGRDERNGFMLTVPDYGTADKETVGSGVEAFHVRFQNEDDALLHVIEAWSDQTGGGDQREVLRINSRPEVDKFGYSVHQVVSQQEAWLRLRAIGGYDSAGQQDASVHVFANRGDGDWNYSRIDLDANIVKIVPYTSATTPSGGMTDGLLVYTDGTWNPGLGEGLYLYCNAAWVKIAGPNDTTYRWGDGTNYAQVDGDGILTFSGVGRIAPRYAATTVTTTATISTATYTRCNSSGGAFTVTLPTAVGITGRVYMVKKVDSSANAVTVDADGSETIDGAASYALTAQWDSVTVVSNGTNWEILATT